jgi:hypothetical protein
MRTLKHKAIINGVETVMLFTPRLFDFKTASMDFSDSGSASKVAGMYADIAYCAALNYWTLEENDPADFELTRVDFHEWAVQQPTEFGKTMKIALEAITNKSLEELLKENEGPVKADEDVKKKNSLSIMQKLKRFWSAIVG